MFPRRGQDIEFAEDLFKLLGKKSSEMVSRALYNLLSTLGEKRVVSQ